MDGWMVLTLTWVGLSDVFTWRYSAKTVAFTGQQMCHVTSSWTSKNGSLYYLYLHLHSSVAPHSSLYVTQVILKLEPSHSPFSYWWLLPSTAAHFTPFKINTCKLQFYIVEFYFIFKKMYFILWKIVIEMQLLRQNFRLIMISLRASTGCLITTWTSCPVVTVCETNNGFPKSGQFNLLILKGAHSTFF